jgi:hypothetical protein
MRETVRSLKAYFIVIAVLGLIKSISTLSFIVIAVLSFRESISTLPFWSHSPLFLIISLIGLAFALAYLYIGISLRKLLAESPKTINNVILASMAYQVLNFLSSLLNGVQVASIVQLAIGLLITWYLLNSVKRLSVEENAKTRAE